MNLEDYLKHMREDWAAQNKQAKNGRDTTNGHHDDSVAPASSNEVQEPDEDE